MAMMIDLRGSSANTENLLRIRSGPANRLKETMQERWLLLRMVCILLECILVKNIFIDNLALLKPVICFQSPYVSPQKKFGAR